MKRMFRPDDEDKPFIARWNRLARIMLVDTAVKHIARVAMDYADFDDGANCHPSNDRIARDTGYSDKTVRMAWSAMRGMGIANRVSEGVSYRRLADKYKLVIPDDWLGLPVVGPHGEKFNCLYCKKVFNPSGNCLVAPNDKVTFDLRPMTFCTSPPIKRPGVKQLRTPKPRKPTCYDHWNEARNMKGEPTWYDANQDRWKWFYEARHDDW